MNIAFFASSLVSAYWNGAATYYRGIVRALHERGHRVTFYEPDAYGRQQHRDMPDPEWARVVVYPGEGEEGVRRALDDARGADLVVKASGVGVFDELLEKAVLDIRRPDGLCVFWDVDAPATQDRMESDPEDRFRALVPRYDLIFTYGGGDPVVERYEALGARECIPIYNALDPETHHPAPPEPRFAAALSYLGTYAEDRQAALERLFVEPARRRPGSRFVIGGAQYPPDFPWTPNIWFVRHLPPAEHPAFYAASRLTLNVTREAMARSGWCPSGRLFEAASCGVPILSDWFDGLDAFFEPGREILIARGTEDALAVLDMPDAELAAVARRARERCLAEHTAQRRAREMVAALESATAPVGGD